MLDYRPKLREGLLATATFAAIALGTLGALDFIVTGGFDFGARRTASNYGSPLIGASVPVWAAEPPASTVTAVTWTDPEAVDEEQTAEDLLDAAAEPGEGAAAPSEDQLYREIAQLYLEQDPREEAAEDAATDALLGDDTQTLYDERDLRPDPNAPDSDR